MNFHYALDEFKKPYPVTIEEAIDLGYFSKGRDDLIRVGRDKIGPYDISTVFLVVNHAHRKGDLVLFETMVFADIPLLYAWEMKRYRTWKQAFEGHQRFCDYYTQQI